MSQSTKTAGHLKWARIWQIAERALSIVAGLSFIGMGLALGQAAVRTANQPDEPAARLNWSIYGAGEGTKLKKAGELRVTASESAGFMVLVDSEPQGAEVLLDGVSIGPTPASANPKCKPGGRFTVEARQPGYASVSEEIACSENQYLLIETKLKKR
jgi:hypothetical protein